MDQERASQEEITADERRCTQIRTVNHPTDRAMIGCIPPGSQSRTISSVCICVHLWFSSCFLAPCDPGEAHHCLDARFEEWNHRCTQMHTDELGQRPFDGDVPRDAYVGAVADNPSHDGEGPARQPIRSLLGAALVSRFAITVTYFRLWPPLRP